jgi:hypothetical protein
VALPPAQRAWLDVKSQAVPRALRGADGVPMHRDPYQEISMVQQKRIDNRGD